MSEDFIDPDGDEWKPTAAPTDGECAHCNDPYEKGDPVLVPNDGGQPMHEACWELHVGYMEAMAKD